MKSWGPNEFYPQDRDEEEAEMYKFSAMVCFVIQGPFGLKRQPPEKGFSFYTSNYFYKKFSKCLVSDNQIHKKPEVRHGWLQYQHFYLNYQATII